jgi:hypothetical protein
MAAKKATKRVTKPNTATPETKRDVASQQKAAAKLFNDADDVHAILGIPPGLTQEQHENNVRRAALGY